MIGRSIVPVLNAAPIPPVESDRAMIEEQKLNLTRVSDSGSLRSALNPELNSLSQNGARISATRDPSTGLAG
jgi:hypothetical protein